MELELKHIVFYLPYGLNARLNDLGIFNLDLQAEEYPHPYRRVGKIEDVSIEKGKIGYGSIRLSDKISFDFEGVEEIDVFLRPLSDLAKPEWEDFIKDNDINISTYNKWGVDMTIDGDTIHWEFSGMQDTLNELYKNHFDISGLIDAGLAIDINTLNPPQEQNNETI